MHSRLLQHFPLVAMAQAATACCVCVAVQMLLQCDWATVAAL